MPKNPSASRKARAESLPPGRRIMVIIISAVIAIALVLTVMFILVRNSGIELDSKSVPELNVLTAERVEGLRGLVEISDVTLQDSEGRVYDEDNRNNLRTELAKTNQFLAELPAADDAGPKQRALDRYNAAEEQFKELFERIRLLQREVQQWDDQH